jgi:hypothetical protein
MVIELGGSVFEITHDLVGDLFRAKNAGVTPISFIQLHKRCTERLPNKLDGRLLQYPYGISLFSLALNTWAFNSFIITINDPRPIYSNNPHREFQATLEMLSSSLLL